METNNRKPLAEAEVGDTLLISSWRRSYLSKVTRVTEASVFCGGVRYSKSTGYCVGNNYFSACIATEEEIKRIEAQKNYRNLLASVQAIDYTKVPSECLAKVLAIVEEYKTC